MNDEAQVLHISANKLWSVIEASFGLFILAYDPFAYSQLIPQIIFGVIGLCAVLFAVVAWRAYITLAGTTLTVRQYRTTSVDIATLSSVGSGSYLGSGADGIKFQDTSGNTAVLMPRLYHKQDMGRLLTALLPHFPTDVTSLPLGVRLRLKHYGIH